MNDDFAEFVETLINDRESEYVEFKDSNDNPNLFGELVSALANGAVLAEKPEAYLVYGVSDETHEIVGTSFDPYKNVKSQPFINLIATNLEYAEELKYRIGEINGNKVVVVTIPRAEMYPVEYKGVPFIRVDSAKKKLREHPELARRLWELILRHTFEEGYATDLVGEDEVFALLDFEPYYTLRGIPMPDSREIIMEAMLNEGVLMKKVNKYYITNLGALFFARKMSGFKSLFNRGVRVIKYRGNNKIGVERSVDFDEGYALCMGKVFDIVRFLIPNEEYMDGPQRRSRGIFSDDMIRELLANMVIHQDFGIDGYCPRVEIYGDRMEFTNSGMPTINVNRFLDLNMSRNAKLARLARFLGLCEERGMGIDKVEYCCEKAFLPSPMPSASDGITRVIVFGHKNLRQFSKVDRVNLVYMHCCFQFVNQAHLTNESLRSRFPEGVMSQIVASRWISETVESGLIEKFDPASSKKNTSYVPKWAK